MRNLTGMRFGKLVVVDRHGSNKWGNATWKCVCDCGNDHIAAGGKLIQGKTKSCGCFAQELHIRQLETHGLTTGGKPRLFTIWNGMRARCANPNSVSYKNYGARGIKVCDEWSSFKNFYYWAMDNGYGDSLQIDRIHNDGNYEPSNCRWVTKSFNLSNQRRNRYITINGDARTVTQWIANLSLNRSTVYSWLRKDESYLQEKLEEVYFNKFKELAPA